MFQYHHPTTSSPPPQEQYQKLLLKHFLLIIENQSLHQRIRTRNNEGKGEQDAVIRRIQEIQASMGEELRCKEIKIGELSKHVREMHRINEELCQQLEGFRKNYRNLEEMYIKEVSDLKSQLLLATSTVPSAKQQRYDQNNHYIRVLQREKQQLAAQLTRCNDVIIKELKTDIEVLSKENQSFMASINGYRSEEKKYKEEIVKLEQEIKRYCQLVNSNAVGQAEWQKNAINLKAQNKKLMQKCEQLTKKHKQQLDNLTKTHNKSVTHLEQTVSQKSSQLSHSLQKIKQVTQQSDRKSKKLKQYDDQYALYVNKMNAMHFESTNIKQEIVRVKEKYEGLLGEEKGKAREREGKLVEGHAKEIEQMKAEMERKGKEIQVKSRSQKVQEIKQLQTELKEAKKQFQMLLQDQQTKCLKLEQERDGAIKQWQQLLQQMNKQKGIIGLLEKEIQGYRKSNREYMIACSGGKTQEKDIGKDMRQMVDVREKVDHILKIRQQPLKIEQSETKRHEEPPLKPQSPVCELATPTTRNTNNNCCLQCQQKVHEGKSYDTITKTRAISNGYNNNNNRKDASPRLNISIQPYLTHDHQRKSLPFSNKQQIERPSLGCRRKDGNFKKYQYLRTKTQESIQNNYQYIPSSNKPTNFFNSNDQNQRPYQSNSHYSEKQPRGQEKSSRWSNNGPQKLIKSSSLQKVDFDRNLDEIQQYLSFDITEVKSISRSASDKKFSQAPSSARLKTQGVFYDSTPQKSLLVEKINNIGFSYRQNNETAKQNKFYNFCKRPPPQTFSRPNRVIQKKAEKENINQIIHRKCQYISQR